MSVLGHSQLATHNRDTTSVHQLLTGVDGCSRKGRAATNLDEKGEGRGGGLVGCRDIEKINEDRT